MPASALVWDLLVKDNASASLNRIAAEADKTATSLARTQTTVERSSAAMAAAGAKLTKSVTLPLVAIGAVGVEQAAKFQKSMTLIQTAAGETGRKTAVIQQGILGLAKSTGTSLSDLSDGIYTVAKAGAQKWSATGQLNVLKAAAQGAKAENVDLGTAVSALTSVMQGYGLSAGKAVEAENEIIRASGLSKTNMQEFAGSLANVVPLASSLHISFAQVGGAIATMTQHGESAQRSTDNLNNLIRNLAGSNNVAVQAMGQLGLKSQDVAKELATKNGLSGALDMVEQAMARSSKNGEIVVSAFKVAQNATHNLGVEIDHMPANLAKLSSAFESGRLSYSDYYSDVKGLGGTAFEMGKQFISTMQNAKGFSNALKSGNPQVQTTAQAFQKLLGGATGMNAALMLSGASAKTFKSSTDQIAAAANHAGVNVLGWGKTQGTLSVQLDKAKENLQVLAVEIGTALIPAITKVVSWATEAVDWFDNLGGGTKKLIGYAALFAASLGPVLYVGGKVVTLYRGITTAATAIVNGASKLVGYFTSTTTAATAANTEISASEARAAAAFAESEARKAEAVAEAQLEIAASVEGTGSILTVEAQEAATAAIEFAAAQRQKAESAISAAATITAAESGLTGAMTEQEAAQVAAARETAAAIAAASREQAAATETSAGRIATAGKTITAGLLAAGGGYLGASLAGGKTGKKSTGGMWGQFGKSVAGGAAGGAVFGLVGGPEGALAGGAIGAAVGAIKGVADVWSDVHTQSKNAGQAAKQALEQQKAAAQDLLQTLQSVGGAYGEQYKQNIVSKLSSSGALSVANQAGVNLQNIVGAVIGKGGSGALTQLNVQLENAAAAGKISFQQLSKVQGVLQQMAPAATSAEQAQELQNKALGQGVLSSSQLGISLGKLRSAMKDTAGSLDTDTAAGKRNIAIVSQNVQALGSAAQAQLNHGRSVKLVTADYEAQIGTLANNLQQLGYSKQAIQGVIAQYAKVPPKVLTQIQQEGIGVVNPEIAALIAKYGQIPSTKTTQIALKAAAAENTLVRIGSMLANLHDKTITVGVRSASMSGAHAVAAGSHAVFGGAGTIPPNTRFTVGERGWEGGFTDSQGRATIFSNSQAKALGYKTPTGYANGSLPGDAGKIAATLASAFGLTRNQIAGFLGNFQVESGFRSNAYNPNENAHGYAQWEGGRWTALQNLAARMGVAATSSKAELAYLVKELRGSGVIQAVKGMSNPAKIAAYVDANYERSSGSTRAQREADAVRIAAVLKRVGVFSSGGPGSGVFDGPTGSAGSVPAPRIADPGVARYMRAAAKSVADAVAAAVLPIKSLSTSQLAGRLSGADSAAVSSVAGASRAGAMYNEMAAATTRLKNQLSALRLEHSQGTAALRAHATALSNDAHKALEAAAAMPSSTKAEKAAKAAAEAHAKALGDEARAASQAATSGGRASALQIAELAAREKSAATAAAKLKSAWSAATAAAKKAQAAAVSAAKALVSSLQSQADALKQAVESFTQGVSAGIAQGSDLASLWSAATDAATTYKDTVASLSQSILGDVSLGTLWTNATDAQATAAQNLADAQQAVADAQDAINQASPDMSSLTAAQNAQAQAQAQFTTAHAQLLAAQGAVAAGNGSPSDYAALTAAQQRQTDTLQALSAANADLATAQQQVASATGPTVDQTNALTTAQQKLAQAEAASAAAGTSNADALKNVVAAFQSQLTAAANFSSDLATLINDGLSVGLAQQIAAMGATAGDQLAQALLAAGPDMISTLNSLGTQAGQSFAGAVAAAGSTPAALQQQFNTVLASAQQFASDLQALAKAGAGEDLISQIAAMGPQSGDALAQQLLAGGKSGIAQFQSTMTQIANLAGSTATDLAKGFFSAGATSMDNLLKGLLKEFPALKAGLAPIIAELQAMFTFTPTVVTPTGSSGASSGSGSSSGGSAPVGTAGAPKAGVTTMIVTSDTTIKALADMYNTTVGVLDGLNAFLGNHGGTYAVQKGAKIIVPSFAKGVASYSGAALVGEYGPELVTFPRPVAVHSTGTPVVDTSGIEREVRQMRQEMMSELAGQIADANDARGARMYDRAGQSAAAYNKRNGRRVGQFSRR